MDYEAAIKQIHETEIVTAAIQARHTAFLKEHQQWLEQSTLAIARHEKWWADHEKAHEKAEARHEAWFAKHEVVMAEIEDKLNGLIGFVDDLAHKPKPE
jgi:DNA-directed RNA polymerase